MPLFARRRLQLMLDELAGVLDAQKAKDLLRRLESDDRVEQVLPAEMELALLWALSKLGDLEVEPEWWGNGRRPDAYTEALVQGQPTIIEIAACSDGDISGENAMHKVAIHLSTCANRIRKGLGEYLYYRFSDESGYIDSKYYRRILAPGNYEISAKAKMQIESWIISGACEANKLRIVEQDLDVEIEKLPCKIPIFHNFSASMPPEAHSIDKNPLRTVLNKKLSQLKSEKTEALRLIFLADVGSTLLSSKVLSEAEGGAARFCGSRRAAFVAPQHG
jgi:hypothetical protein